MYPTHAEINGELYPIKTDYRVAKECYEIINDDTISDQERALAVIYKLFGFVSLENGEEFLDKASFFLTCGQKQENKSDEPPDFDVNEDEGFIEASFKSCYGVDLDEVDMHWWKFNDLRIGISMDSAGIFYETVTAGNMKGVMLEANQGNGYQIAIDNSSFNVAKTNSTTALTLVEDVGLGFTQQSATVGLGVTSWSYGKMSEADRMVLFSTYGMAIASQGSLCLHGENNIWLCGTVRLADYYQYGTGRAPLYINRQTGEITI